MRRKTAFADTAQTELFGNAVPRNPSHAPPGIKPGDTEDDGGAMAFNACAMASAARAPGQKTHAFNQTGATSVHHAGPECDERATLPGQADRVGSKYRRHRAGGTEGRRLGNVNDPDLPPLMTAREVADHLRLSASTVRRLTKAGHGFPQPRRIGGSLRWLRAEINQYLGTAAEPAARNDDP